MNKIPFRNVGGRDVTPPDKNRPVPADRTGTTCSVEWVERLERAGNIRRTDNASTVFPSDNVKESDGDSD